MHSLENKATPTSVHWTGSSTHVGAGSGTLSGRQALGPIGTCPRAAAGVLGNGGVAGSSRSFPERGSGTWSGLLDSRAVGWFLSGAATVGMGVCRGFTTQEPQPQGFQWDPCRWQMTLLQDRHLTAPVWGREAMLVWEFQTLVKCDSEQERLIPLKETRWPWTVSHSDVCGRSRRKCQPRLIPPDSGSAHDSLSHRTFLDWGHSWKSMCRDLWHLILMR